MPHVFRRAFLLTLAAGPAMSQSPVPALAPTGTLRAAINFGNPVLAQRGADGTPGGVTIVLARRLAERLGVPLSIVPFESAGSVTDALPRGVFDVCFLAIDPVRGKGLAFTAPYVLIEGGYAARDPRFRTVPDVDGDGVSIAVAKGSAYDLFLTRDLRRATLVRYPDGNAAARAYLDGNQDVLAGVKQPLMALAAANPHLRVLPGRFMSIEQAMATPRDRDPAALVSLQAFVADMKSDGTVARALAESGQHDAEVAS